MALRYGAMKGTFTLAVYAAIMLTGAAFGQADEPLPVQPRYKAPSIFDDAFRTDAPKLPISVARTLGLGTPMTAPPSRPVERVVITRGMGGRISDHRTTFEGYFRAGAKVELRGPCYSACTLITGCLERENLCIAPGAFLAFHAARGAQFGNYLRDERTINVADQHAKLGLADAKGVLQDGGEDRLEPAGRVRYDAQHLRSRCLLLSCLRQFAGKKVDLLLEIGRRRTASAHGRWRVIGLRLRRLAVARFCWSTA